MMDKWKYTKR